MNKPTEIIYVDETIYNEPPPSEASGMKKGEWRELAIMHYRTAYILKSKYDELSLDNARLAADLAKVEAELEKVKGENEILSRPISQEPLIAKDIPCTCDWQKVYPHLSVKCNPSSCKKTK